MPRLKPPSDPNAKQTPSPRARRKPAAKAARSKAPSAPAAPRAPRDEGAHTEAATPEFASGTRPTPPPKLDASPAFLFRAHPERWTILEGAVVPILGKIKLQDGVNRCRMIDGKFHAQDAIAASESAGWVTIPHDVDGLETTYLRRPKGAPHVWLSRFERVFPGSTVIEPSREYVPWLLSLIERGVLKPCPLYVLERIEAQTAKDHGDAADLAHSVPSYRATAERFSKDLEAVRAEIEVRLSVASAADVDIDDPGMASSDDHIEAATPGA